MEDTIKEVLLAAIAAITTISTAYIAARYAVSRRSNTNDNRDIDRSGDSR